MVAFKVVRGVKVLKDIKVRSELPHALSTLVPGCSRGISTQKGCVGLTPPGRKKAGRQGALRLFKGDSGSGPEGNSYGYFTSGVPSP